VVARSQILNRKCIATLICAHLLALAGAANFLTLLFTAKKSIKMKKQVAKLSLKTDKVVSLSKAQLQDAQGGAVPFTQKKTCFCL